MDAKPKPGRAATAAATLLLAGCAVGPDFQRPAPPGRCWPDAVVYQVYFRSFPDANCDGIRDLRGVRERLPYLQDLGVNAL